MFMHFNLRQCNSIWFSFHLTRLKRAVIKKEQETKYKCSDKSEIRKAKSAGSIKEQKNNLEREYKWMSFKVYATAIYVVWVLLMRILQKLEQINEHASPMSSRKLEHEHIYSLNSTYLSLNKGQQKHALLNKKASLFLCFHWHLA